MPRALEMVGSQPESASYAGGPRGGCIRVRRSSPVGIEVARAAKIGSDKRRILVRQAASRLPHAIACRSVNSETHALRGLAQTSCPGVGWCVRCAWLFSRHYRRKYETSLATCSPGVLGANARQGWPSAASTASLGRRALLNPYCAGVRATALPGHPEVAAVPTIRRGRIHRLAKPPSAVPRESR